MTESKKFCLMTFGRAGSTALINALQSHDDIMVPNKNIDCPDNELVHLRFVKKYAAQYGQLCNQDITMVNQLIDCFYAHNAGAPYVGFKSMPNRHHDFLQFVNRRDIRFITLVRADIPSTVASFMVASVHNTWRRDGGKQAIRYSFSEAEKPKVVNNLQYIAQSLDLLRRVPDAIRLTYEELCSPDFRNEQLDAYFGRPVKLINPKPPTTAESYVENWPQFCQFVNATYSQMQQQLLARRAAPAQAPTALRPA